MRAGTAHAYNDFGDRIGATPSSMIVDSASIAAIACLAEQNGLIICG
jgi:hypothetical protein